MDAALDGWLAACAQAGWRPALGSRTVPVTAARGEVTAAVVRARRAVPAYRAAAMDGIAVTTADVEGPGPVRLAPGQFDPVDTGDPLSDERDAVVPHEQLTTSPDGGALVAAWPAPGRHVRRIGEDVEAGAVVLPAGHRIRAVDAAALAGAGRLTVEVRHRPVVAVLPTGDEIRPIGSVLGRGEIADTNSLMLGGLAEEAGCTALPLPICPDDPAALGAAVRDAARRSDLVLVLAGSSTGRDDHTARVIGRLGLVAVHGVAVRPGHPVVLGVLTAAGTGAVPVVGVPGYPASAERVFRSFVLPLLGRLAGTAPPPSRAVVARLSVDVHSPAGSDEYLRVRLARVPDPGTGAEALVVVPLPRGAGAMSSLVQAEAVLRIPPGVDLLPAGSVVQPHLVDGAADPAGTVVVRGPLPPAAGRLLARHADRPSAAVHWAPGSAVEAVDAVAAGLCHAAAVRFPAPQDRTRPEAVDALTRRLGPVVTTSLQHGAGGEHVLVVPMALADLPPVARLRDLLRSSGTEVRPTCATR